MKILFIADIHGFLEGLERVKEYLGESGIHAVFLMGDYSLGFKDTARNKTDAETAVAELKDRAGVYAIPGNCDFPLVVDLFEKYGANAHEKTVVLDGVSFVCLGGSNETPFGTPFEMEEDYIRQKLDSLLGRAKTGKTVLVTHFPPKDTACDNVPDVGHVGSQALRNAIETYQPDICTCSHIHECAGKTDRIGQTRIYNVGPLRGGNAIALDTTGLAVHYEIINR
ncbi:MAG: metallophosphoesterase [Candidatus Altiarchaeota archaeon]|nr:metallophosphoesterase [Candidatus Altiarchaeota archaeon]